MSLPPGSGAGIPLNDNQRLAWLRLTRSENVGPATFRDLINHFGSAARALDMLPELSRRGGSGRPIRVMSEEDGLREMAIARKHQARFIAIGEPDYPDALRLVDGAPPVIAVIGDGAVLQRPAVGLVGARNASISGCKFAAKLALELGQAGYSTVSGLARGIDASVHRATLNTGTIAVLAGGLDQPYPPENVELFGQICNLGAVVSEMPFGWVPRSRDFPRRNRIVAGIGLGLVVIEAAQRSGSLISANRAADYGRLVFAVPGSPLDPRAAGTNALLKEGALVTTGSADILEALAPQTLTISQDQVLEEDETQSEPLDPPSESDRARIISGLSQTPTDIDDIIRFTNLPAATVHLAILELDLADRIQRHPGGKISLVEF